jgi:transposase
MATQIQIFTLYDQGHSVRKISLALGMCRRTIRRYLRQRDRMNKGEGQEKIADKIAIPSSQLAAKNEADILERFPQWLQNLDWKTILNEKRKGVPYKILYEEQSLTNVKYWSFWKHLSRLDKELKPEMPKTTMRLLHKPGEKVFVDYTDGIDIIDPDTGEVKKTHLFIGCLPFSSKTYAEFCFNQKLQTFISSHEKMWEFFGGVAKYVVCDNLKSGVQTPRLYDPDANKVFVTYANHAGFAVLPARSRKPKDKAAVETHAGIFQRSFYQEVRNQQFKSIGELNDALKKFLIKFNQKEMKEYGISRDERFSEEVSLLQEPPKESFFIPEIKEATVHPDCHIQVKNCFYSVPWQYVGKKVRVVLGKQLEIFDIFTLERIAVHSLGRKLGERKTNELHWPPEKKEHCDFNIDRGLQEAKKVGHKTYEMVNYLFSLPHPLVYLRRVQGLLRQYQQARFSKDAMEYASKMAMQHQKFSCSYFNNCAKYFDSDEQIRAVGNGSPKRELKHLHLQK